MFRFCSCIQFSWIPRSANSAAHSLASWALLNKISGSFVIGSAPQIFTDVILAEQSF